MAKRCFACRGLYGTAAGSFTPIPIHAAMNIISLYSISLGAFFGLCFLWRIAHLVHDHYQLSIPSWLRKRLKYTLVTQRVPGSYDVDPLALLAIITYVAGNIFCLSYRVSSRLELATRASSLFAINVIPIYLGARSNVILDRFLKVRLREIVIVHHWMGRTAMIHATVHAVARATMLNARIRVPEILVMLPAAT